MLSDEWLSRYGLLENFNASVTRTRTGTGTGTWTTGVTAIALCTSCSRAKKRKKKVFLGLGATKPIDHTRARMASRLVEIRAKVMCCMPTMSVSTADTLNHQDPFIQTTWVAAHGKRAAPLFDRVLRFRKRGATGQF